MYGNLCVRSYHIYTISSWVVHISYMIQKHRFIRPFSIPCIVHALICWKFRYIFLHFWSKPWFLFTFCLWFYYVNHARISAARLPTKKPFNYLKKKLNFTLSWTIAVNQIIIINNHDKLNDFLMNSDKQSWHHKQFLDMVHLIHKELSSKKEF